MRQTVSNACYDLHYGANAHASTIYSGERTDIYGTCGDCGGHAPDGKPCACECHTTAETPAAPASQCATCEGPCSQASINCDNCNRRFAQERYERSPLPEMVSAATRRHVYVWLGADCGESTPLDDLITDLKAAIAEAEAMRSHAHSWNEDDYCDICGTDGRA